MKILLLVAIGLLSGCFSTPKLFEKPFYTEEINDFFTDESGEKLIFIGQEYHYIFDNQKSLTSILNSEKRRLLKAHFSEFFITQNGEIQGEYLLTTNCNTINKSDMQWLQNYNFTKLDKPCSNSNTSYLLEQKISGVRYLRYSPNNQMNERYSPNNQMNEIYSTLNRNYSIRIRRDNAADDIAMKITMSPVTIMNDVILLGIGMAALPLYPVGAALVEMSEQ